MGTQSSCRGLRGSAPKCPQFTSPFSFAAAGGMSRVLNSYEQGGFSNGKNTPSTNARTANFISQSCRTISNNHYRLYTRSTKRITRTDVLRLSGAARAPVALGNLLVFLLWRVGSRLLHNCHYCFALCLT